VTIFLDLASAAAGQHHQLCRASTESSKATSVARANVVLSDVELERLLTAARAIDAEDAWDGHLFHLVAYLAATGARFSQIARCTVGEFQPELERLMVVVSQKGQGKKRRRILRFRSTKA
jgi:site-specific recombinase XerD